MSLDPEAAGLQGLVTTTVTRRIKPGHHAAYQAFLAGNNHVASALPGYLGMEVFCPCRQRRVPHRRHQREETAP
jgi:antibiotic biosynthesis monooxygenase (ABM) superfamily enzyme